MTRLYSLDMFRGIAIILVILSHLGSIYDLNHSTALGVGRYGVVLFYIVSGFTIFYVLTIRDRNTDSFLIFYKHRFFRIAPLFYFLLLLIFIFHDNYSFSSFLFVGYADYDNFNQLLHVEWSIYVEVLFYLIAPLVFFNTRLKTFHLLLMFLLLSILYRSIFYQHFFVDSAQKEFWFFNPINFLYTFFIGAWLYQLIERAEAIKPIQILAFLFTTLVLIAMTKVILTDNFFMVGDYLFSALFSLIIYIKFKFFSLFRLRLIEFIGLISYSLYLWHFLVFKALAKIALFGIWYIDVLLGILTVITISILSYFFIEKPGIKLGKVIFK